MYLSENCVKSDMRSHILSPLRAALAEYTGPIPFFVVPRLETGTQTAGETKRDRDRERKIDTQSEIEREKERATQRQKQKERQTGREN